MHFISAHIFHTFYDNIMIPIGVYKLKLTCELMPVMEDEHGTYIMNSKDLRAIEHVQRLVEIGVPDNRQRPE
jgi:collagenase-like PrtC family protease